MSDMIMENNNINKDSFSWWWGSHNTPNHSPWLQSTLSDLDEKTKAMLSLIIQEEGDSFAQRAEMYYMNRSKLIKMVEEFHRSYRSLAERLLRSDSARVSHSGSSSSNSFRHFKTIPSASIISKVSNVSTSDSNPASSTVVDPESDTTKIDFEYLNKIENELIPNVPITKSNSKEEVKIDNNHGEGKCGRKRVTSKKTNGFELGRTQDGEVLEVDNNREEGKCGREMVISKKTNGFELGQNQDKEVLEFGNNHGKCAMKTNGFELGQNQDGGEVHDIDNNHGEVKCDREGFAMKTNGFCHSQDGQSDMGSLEREAMWSDMKFQVSKLIEDNLWQQSELIRRNDEKRKAIKELCFQLNKLTEENRTLQTCFRCSRVAMKQNQSQMSKLKLILGKFLGGGCSP